MCYVLEINDLSMLHARWWPGGVRNEYSHGPYRSIAVGGLVCAECGRRLARTGDDMNGRQSTPDGEDAVSIS